MSGKSMNFGDKKILKSNFYKNEKVIKIDDIDINKILVSKQETYRLNYLNNFEYIIFKMTFTAKID